MVIYLSLTERNLCPIRLKAWAEYCKVIWSRRWSIKVWHAFCWGLPFRWRSPPRHTHACRSVARPGTDQASMVAKWPMGSRSTRIILCTWPTSLYLSGPNLRWRICKMADQSSREWPTADLTSRDVASISLRPVPRGWDFYRGVMPQCVCKRWTDETRLWAGRPRPPALFLFPV